MSELFILLGWVVRFFTFFLVFRIVIEMIQSFSRNWRPQRWFMIIAEPIFVITDPPVKALRKLIPPLRMGGIALDLSVLALFFILQILAQVFFSLA